MGWLRSVGSIKLQVSFAEYHLFYRSLLQKRPMILSILLTKATPYWVVCILTLLPLRCPSGRSLRYVFVHVCVCMCMCTYMCICICVCMYVCICVYAYTVVYLYIDLVATSLLVWAITQVCICTCMCMYVHVYMYVCVYVCMYMCICIHGGLSVY